MVEYLQALECIGCGRLERPQPCIGICQDRIVDLVYAGAYKEALAQAERADRLAREFEGLVKRLAWTTPRGGEWERSYRTLQAEAHRILSSREAVNMEDPGLRRDVANQSAAEDPGDQPAP